MSETASNAQLSGKMFLFDQPELINHEQHGDLALSPVDHRFAFCSKIKAVPVTVSEIAAAAKDYPIIFASNEQFLPVAVVGIVDDVNLFVDENGEWEPHRYIPGYLRRYPFGVASETGGTRMAVVIDRAFKGLSPDGDQKLFENNEPTEATRQAIEFCRTFEEDRVRTKDLAEKFKTFDIIKGQSASYTPQGSNEPRNFAEYLGVDESAIRDMDNDTFIEFRKTGALPLAYMMAASMQNWRTLLARRQQRFNLSEEAMLTPAAN